MIGRAAFGLRDYAFFLTEAVCVATLVRSYRRRRGDLRNGSRPYEFPKDRRAVRILVACAALAATVFVVTKLLMR